MLNSLIEWNHKQNRLGTTEWFTDPSIINGSGAICSIILQSLICGGRSITKNNDYPEFLTIKEQVFLHLKKNNHQTNKYMISESITEQGIRDRLNCDHGYLCRVLKKFEDNGFIYRKKMKVRNKKRKCYAFFLTEKGDQLADRILSSIETN